MCGSLNKLAILVILAATLAATVSAQQLATLHVSVTDQSGGAIPNAEIVIQSVETGAKRNSTTNADGLALLAGLPAGNYRAAVSAAGFGPYSGNLGLTVGSSTSMTAVLSLGAKHEEIEVRETAEGIDTQEPGDGQVIDGQRIANLPIAGRDFIDFVLLTPTANVGRSTAVGAQSPFQETVLELSFAGLRETHSTFFGLDGIDYATSISGVQRSSPSQDWVLEFRVEYSPITADVGGNLGSVINTVTKSGSNQTHGSAYEFFRNNAMDAHNLLSVPGFNTLRFNQFGGYLGGPIRKDKLFYFLGYEGQRRAESPLYSSFILHCTDSPGCLGPGTPSINQVKEMLGLQPENLGSLLQIEDYDKYYGKLTEVISNATTLNVGYLFTTEDNLHVPGAPPGQGMPSFYRNNPIQDQTAYANLLHLFSNRWTSETILSFGNRTFHLNPTGAGLEPTLLVSDLFFSGGIQGGVHYYSEQHFAAAENLTYIQNKHVFKFGAGLQPVWIGAQTAFFTPGAGIFTPQSFFGAAPFDAPPFGPGTPVEFLFQESRSYFGQQIPPRTLPFETGLYAGPAGRTLYDSTNMNFLHKLMGFYAQDQWKARTNLTLTLGLRYDIDFFPSASELKLNGAMHPTNYGNVQPRAGLAYSFRNGKGVLRAGFGMFTGPFDYSDILVSWQGASAFSYMKQPLLPQFSDPISSLVGLGQSGIVGVEGPVAASQAFSAFAHTGAYPAPSSLAQFPLGYAQREFPNAYAEQATIEVENQVAKDLFVSIGYQFVHGLKLPLYLSINGLPSGTTPSGVQAFTPADPNFGFSLMAVPVGNSIYNGAVLTVRKPFAHHFSIAGNYVFSKSIDISTDVQLTDAPMNYLNPSLDRSVGDNDVRHRFVLTLLGESPNTWMPALRSFKVSMLNTLESPRYYTLFAGFDVNGDGFPFNDRVGTIGRNTFRGDSSYTTDLRVQRQFPLRDQWKLDLSAEIFNLFNRPNVEAIDTVYGAATFVGPVPQKFHDGITSSANPTFGTPSYVAPARQIQFALRLNF